MVFLVAISSISAVTISAIMAQYYKINIVSGTSEPDDCLCIVEWSIFETVLCSVLGVSSILFIQRSDTPLKSYTFQNMILIYIYALL